VHRKGVGGGRGEKKKKNEKARTIWPATKEKEGKKGGKKKKKEKFPVVLRLSELKQQPL